RDQIFPAAPRPVVPLSVSTVRRLVVPPIAVVEQRGELWIDAQHDVGAPAAVTAVGAAVRNECFAAEAHRAGPTPSRFHLYDRMIQKHRFALSKDPPRFDRVTSAGSLGGWMCGSRVPGSSRSSKSTSP